MTTEILDDAEAVAQRAADVIIAAANEAIGSQGRFTLVLTGGKTPKRTYELLAEPARAGRIDWTKTFIFEGDERFGPLDSPDSNYGMAKRALLDHVPIPADHVFPMPTEDPDRQEVAAESYAKTLADFFGLTPHGVPAPRFDLILLGLGSDGHCASLFPTAESLEVVDAWTVPTPPGTLPPPVDRLSLTFPVLNNARKVLFIVTGSEKAEAVQDILHARQPKDRRPAVAIRPPDGTVHWVLDRAAAGGS